MIKFAKKYFKLLTEDYAGINLTRINDFDEFYNKQILDSTLAYSTSSSFSSSTVRHGVLVDIGFGGGFPILPLAKTLPKIKFLGIETRNKKVKVVTEIARQLSLDNVSLYHSRVENIVFDVPVTITFKAVGKVYDFLSKLNLEHQCDIYFYKGPNFYDIEAEQLSSLISDWEIIEEIEIDIPNVEKRLIIGFRNKKVPCGTITKSTINLVKLSDIL